MENVDVYHVGDAANILVQNLLDIIEKKKNVTNKISPSIYRVPSTLRNLSQTSFKPRVVSIGPLHRKDENLQAFEGRKAEFVHDLLNHANKSPSIKTLQACVREVAGSIEQIKQCYAGLANTYSDNELTEMMVMDACFILEFVRKISESVNPTSKVKLLDHQIAYDLVLLENQIPFFVLEIIFHITVSAFEERVFLIQFIHPLLKIANIFQAKIKISNSHTDDIYHDHILGVLHHFYQPKYCISSYFPSSTIHSAIELDRAGVSFKPNQDSKWPMAMEVKKHRFTCFSWSWFRPTLTMPTLRINHFTELVLRNLIAYEQSSSLVCPCVTSYAMAMDMLIDTKEDIDRLVRSKVVINHIGSNEEAANMINKLCKEIVWGNFFYSKQWEKLDRHCNGRWPRKILWLKRTYFNSPWSFIALLAAIVLFVLSVVQTIFTVNPRATNN